MSTFRHITIRQSDIDLSKPDGATHPIERAVLRDLKPGCSCHYETGSGEVFISLTEDQGDHSMLLTHRDKLPKEIRLWADTWFCLGDVKPTKFWLDIPSHFLPEVTR